MARSLPGTSTWTRSKPGNLKWDFLRARCLSRGEEQDDGDVMCADDCCQAVYSPVLDEFRLSTPTLAATAVQRLVSCNA
jgi:hypothetical protein